MKNRLLSTYDLFLIIGVTVCSLAYAIYSVSSGISPLGETILSSIAGIAGVSCVVLVAKGSIWNYAFGVVNVSLYALISYKSGIYGDAALNALYYFPMQFVGWWQWRKCGADVSDNSKLQAKRLTPVLRIVVAALCALLVVACGFLLKHLDDPQPFKDASTTVLSVVAQALMSMAFMEQWALWIITNIISIVMWLILSLEGNPSAWLMVIMWCFYLLNSVNGLRVWLKLSSSK